jgi:exodeoxyribonuclease VII small subunit
MPSKTPQRVEKPESASDLPFEKALERLEAIVQSLENGETGLDQSLDLYAEGIKLSKQCFGQLTKAETKVKELSQDANGLFRLLDTGLEDEEKE